MMDVGTDSIRFPFRASRSRLHGCPRRITPTVQVPAPSSETAKPRRRAKFPPVAVGRTTGVLVNLLKGCVRNDRNWPSPALFMTGRGIEVDTPDLAPLHYSSSLPTGRALSYGLVSIVGWRGFIALRQQFLERIARAVPWHDDQAAVLNTDIHSSTGPEFEKVEKCWWHREHD